MSDEREFIDEYIKHVEKYYSSNGSKYHSCYDGEGDYPSNAFRMEIARKLVKNIAPRPAAILDAGCGDARVLAELEREGFPCTGFDNNDLMLELGSKILVSYGLPKDKIRKADIYNIPFADNSFDLIICLGVLSNLPKHDQIFLEFSRVLKPHGRIVVSFTNQLFDLITLNKYTIDFYRLLMDELEIPLQIMRRILEKNTDLFKLEEVPVPIKAMFDTDIDKSMVQIEQYSQLNIVQKFKPRNYLVEEIRHYHYHPFQPRYEKENMDMFMKHVRRFETTEYDWKGALLCSAMVVQLIKDS